MAIRNSNLRRPAQRMRGWSAVVALAYCLSHHHHSFAHAARSYGRIHLPGRPFATDDDDEPQQQAGTHQQEKYSWKGAGREFNLFDNTRSGGAQQPDLLGSTTASTSMPASAARPSSTAPNTSSSSSTTTPRSYSTYGRYGGRRTTATTRRSTRRQESTTPLFQNMKEWWADHVKHFPKLQCRVEPTTTLKIRKTFRPLKTIVTLGADFNTQLGVWQFKSSWEDAIIGGKLTLAGRELQLTKSWQLSVGAVEDLVTRLRFRAAVDLGTMKAYARVGFRTERLSPLNMVEGFTIKKQLPLDGTDGHVKLEVKANFALPEPEIEYSTESHRSMVGMGDMEVNIEELNLILDY